MPVFFFFQPPKKRYRPVVKSSVIQQRQKMNSHLVPTPDHISSFLMFTRDYFSKKKPQPTDPKVSIAVQIKFRSIKPYIAPFSLFVNEM